MNTNLHAWLILALGVSSPSAAAIARGRGSSTSVARWIICQFVVSTLLSSAFVVAKDAVVATDGATSSSSAGRPLQLFLRQHRELQGLICDANSDPDVVGKSCTNNKDCPPNKGSGQGKCISGGTAPTPGPQSPITCGYCEVETSISCSTDSDCPVSGGGLVCNSDTICPPFGDESCADDACLVDSDCLPNTGPSKGKCIQASTTATSCIASSCSPTAPPSSGNPTTTSGPTVSPTKKPTGSPVPVTEETILTFVWDNGNYEDGYSAASEPYPLHVCRGDCDGDSDCDGSLICFKRDGVTPVPGCSGEGVSAKDYCYDPNAENPTNSPTRPQPTNSPTRPQPTERPTTRSPSYDKVYEYTTEGSPDCIDKDGVVKYQNDQGPPPDVVDTVLQFLAFGDTPYDGDAEPCIAENGVDVENPCEWLNCGSTSSLPVENTCTFAGPEFECIRDSIIPYVNTQMETGKAAFLYHCGDMINSGGGKRCNRSSFKARQELFNQVENFVIIPGDNDWNECEGYDIKKNDGDQRDDWRELFADTTSPFNKFKQNFPGENDFPDIERKTTANAQGDVNSEIFFFRYNDIAILGLNSMSGGTYIRDTSPVDINAEWIADRLGDDCSFQSIIILSHSRPNDPIFGALDAYFNKCGIIPSLVVKGSSHPLAYCMEHDASKKRTTLTVEAFMAGPLSVSVVRDLNGSGDYFHVEDSDTAISNLQCPDFA